MGVFHVDGRAYEADPSRNLLEVCLERGLDLPFFCWHPALGSVGACRQCAVTQFKDEEGEKKGQGKLVMACMTAASEGVRIAMEDEASRTFRRSVAEWLMINHPHDCPVCDEGGECHLQDMTVMTGHDYRRARVNKRTFRNQDLGPLLNHEMNRCITCYRCVRFYRDHAGGADLVALGAHDHVYFGRHRDGTLQSPFSGNLVEVCPTGVFTDKTLKKHYTRKWDLQTAPSVCVHCSLGCNTIPGERQGSLRRIRARYHGAVNGYFLCDRGRYGYEFVNGPERLTEPLLPRGTGEPAVAVSAAGARERLADWFADRERLVGIGSPRATLEANFALRTLTGSERFFQGVDTSERRLVGRALEIHRRGLSRTPPLRELERADAVLLLDEDPTGTAPLLALALRQSVREETFRLAGEAGIPRWNDAAVREHAQHRHGPLYVAAPGATGLDDVATHVFRAPPEEIARLGFAIAHALDPESPAVPSLSKEMQLLAEDAARALREAKRPAVVSGTSLGSEAVLEAAADVAWSLGRGGEPVDLFLTLPECNSLGLALLGRESGDGLADALEMLEGGRADTLVVLENDLERRADPVFVERLLGAASRVLVLDHSAHHTAARAGLVLPVASFAEGDGTWVNNEGRAQRSYRVFVPEAEAMMESWRWIRDGMDAAGRQEASRWHSLDDVLAAIAEHEPALAGVTAAAPPADYRRAGARIPRQPFRYSGRTALHANRSMHEPRPPADPDSPLSFSMEGAEEPPPAGLIPRFWAPGWNSIQSLHRFQEEIGGPLRGGDAGARLLEPTAAPGRERPPYFSTVPEPFAPREGEYRVVLRHHVFGSEELSARAPGVAALRPEPYAALHPADAEALHVEKGGSVAVSLPSGERTLPLLLDPTLRRGTVALPHGLRDLPHVGAADWVHVTPGGSK